MANPPITIGPFTNVPAPGSPIRSNWPQQLTQFVVDRWPASLQWRYATVAAATNANGDALINFPTPFPNTLITAIVTDSTQAFPDIAFIVKFMNAASNRTTLVVRVFDAAGAKVVSNGSITLSYVALGN